MSSKQLPTPTLTNPDTTPKDSATPTEAQTKSSKGSIFWLSFTSIILSTLLSALDLTAVGTALPTITRDLNGADKFAWVGSAYSLATTAFLLLSGNLADILGRRPVMLLSVALFLLGSALAGSAQSMEWLIGARTIQGIGGGGILSLSEIITSDLVPLTERGLYQGLLTLAWSFASAIGPIVGGSLAEKASWRWLFYLNLPIGGIAFAFVLFFLRVRTPRGNMWNKLASVDWVGNLIVIAGSTLSNIGLAWAGVRYPWSDVHVLAPLIIGLFLVGAFIVYQRYVPKFPTIPWDMVTNRTALSAFIGTFIHGIVSIAFIYYLPVYFQAVLAASPIRSGVNILPAALLIAPAALVGGIAVQMVKRYLPANYIGWALSIVGFGTLSTLQANSQTANWAGLQVLPAIGMGILYAASVFPLLAALSVERAASALAFLAFMRSFAHTFGITICATILQNELKRNLPSDFTSQFSSGVEIAYAAIKYIPTIPEPLQTNVKVAFADSMSVIWKTVTGIAGAGLLSVLLMKEEKMHDVVDKKFALIDKKRESAAPRDGSEKV